MIICTRCGKENQDQHKFCLRCGGELSATPPAPAPTPPPPAAPPSPFGPPPPAVDMGGSAMAKTMMADPGALPGNTGGPAGPAGQPAAPFGGAPFIAPTPFSPPPGAAPLPGMPPATPGAPPAKPKSSPGALPSPLAAVSAGGAPPVSFGSPAGGSPFAPPSTSPPPAMTPMAPPAPFAAPPLAAAPPAGSPIAPQAAPTAPIACPTCATPIPPGFKFCGNCGTRIDAMSAAMPATPAPVAPPVVEPPPVAAVPKLQGRLTLIRPDGTEGGTHDIVEGSNRIGRTAAPIFENDGYLSPDHAELVLSAGAIVVRDQNSLNGVFVKMVGEEEIQPTDVFRIGQELMRFDTIAPPAPLEDGTEIMGSPNPGYWGRISVIIGKDIDGSAFPLLGDAVTLGRERGDINFPDDGYVSGLHARLSTRNGRYYLADLGSSNGTFIRLRGERVLSSGSFVLLGQQLFRINFGVQ